MRGGIELAPGLVIPESELQWRYSTPGGPGGQHANRTAARADLSVDLRASSLPGEVVDALISRLGRRAESGVVTVSAAGSRSQWRNRQEARRRLGDLLRSALRQHPPRKPTAPSPASVERRLAVKRALSRRKQLRKPPDEE